jgi:FkbM family methyltransferase
VPDESCQRDAFVEVLLNDSYRLGTLAKSVNIKTVIDIGANAGLFGLASRAAFPTATIHAYEPNPALARPLAHNAELAGVAFFLEAVGRTDGYISLDVVPGGSVLSRSRTDPTGSIRQIAFRDALKRIGGHADLVKMDCEGAEWEILEDHESWQKVNFLTMEYHLTAGQGHEAIVSALERIGFAVRSHRPATTFGLVLAQRKL